MIHLTSPPPHSPSLSTETHALLQEKNGLGDCKPQAVVMWCVPPEENCKDTVLSVVPFYITSSSDQDTSAAIPRSPEDQSRPRPTGNYRSSSALPLSLKLSPSLFFLSLSFISIRNTVVRVDSQEANFGKTTSTL